jgi:lysyl-tRNA synthetase class 2
VLVAGVAVAHLVKGLDAEEAGASLVLLVALIGYRRHFDVAGDPNMRPLMLTVAALASLIAALLLSELDESALPEDVIEVVTATATLLAFRGLYLWLRSWRDRDHPTVGERALARGLVERYGRDSLAYFALRRDKSYYFSASHEAFLAYTVLGGTALVSGDPVGDAKELPLLLDDFRCLARRRGWRVAILSAGEELLPLYRRAGFRAIKVGDEAFVRPSVFSLEGRPIRKVRQSVHRLRRAGFTAAVVEDSEVDESLRAALLLVSDEWLGRWPERGFSMAMTTSLGIRERSSSSRGTVRGAPADSSTSFPRRHRAAIP